MSNKNTNNSEYKNTQEHIFNRILINLGIAIIAYIFLYIIYAKFFMTPAIPFAIAFIAIALICYILSATTKFRINKHYAHMFLAFGICLLFTRLSLILGTVMGLEKFMELVNSSNFFKILVNSRYEVIFVTWAGIIYLIGMFIYNSVLINKKSKNKKIVH